jgi:hypothetical protein
MGHYPADTILGKRDGTFGESLCHDLEQDVPNISPLDPTTTATGPKPFTTAINLAIFTVLFFPYRKTETSRKAEVREASSATGVRFP